MSVRNSALVAAAATALGQVVNGDPICEGLLNDLSVTAFGAAEIDTVGHCLVLVTVGGEVRPVADSLGNVRLYLDAGAVMSLAKRSNIAANTQMKIVKFVKTSAVGDPIAALKAKYKSFKSEVALATKQAATVTAKVSAGVALGWDTAVGTPENTEYLDLVARGVAIAEWKTYGEGRVTALAASLTAAGIDPATVV